MIRHCWLLVLCGCAGVPAHPEGPLDRLIARSNAYSSFHAKGEISDGKSIVPVEMAFRAPDQAILRYGTVSTTIVAGGKIHRYLRGSYSVLDAAAMVQGLRERYPNLDIGRAPDAVFTQGDGVRAALSFGRLGARLGWLEELRTYEAQGNVYRHGQTEIVLREDGFIDRTSLPGVTFTLRSVAVGTPLPDSLFALPPSAGLPEPSERIREAQVLAFEESYRRWILESSTRDETLEALVRAEIIRRYLPDKMVALLDESLKKSLSTFRAQHPDASPEYLKDKLVIDRGRSMASVEVLEEEILKTLERDLEGYFRAMPDPPSPKEQLDIRRRWEAAVKRQIDELIRARFQAVFDAVQKDQ